MAQRGRKPGQSVAPANETKEQRFVRLATTRTNRIISGLNSLGKLSGNNYGYTPEQVEKIFRAISDTAREAHESFQGKKRSQGGFAL